MGILILYGTGVVPRLVKTPINSGEAIVLMVPFYFLRGIGRMLRSLRYALLNHNTIRSDEIDWYTANHSEACCGYRCTV